MSKLYTVALYLAIATILACSLGPVTMGTGGAGTGGQGGWPGYGIGGPVMTFCECIAGTASSSCKALCGAAGPMSCESPCGECVETQGEGRRAFVCNGTPGGITVYFNAEGKPHVCDGYTSDHCASGTDCAAFSNGGMLVGTCL